MGNSSELKYFELQHAFLRALGISIVGPAKGPFAVYDEDQEEILVFNPENSVLTDVNLTTNSASLPLAIAKRNNASFTVQDGMVLCEIGKSSAIGESYAEAAMRAFIKFKHSQSQI